MLNNLNNVTPRTSRSLPLAYTAAGCMTTGALFLTFLIGLLFLSGLQLGQLFTLDEAGYGDSYVLYDVQHFQKTGVIYRDLSQPPYLPAQYSPLVYLLYAVPGRILLGNPFFGPRLIALGAFVLCLAMVVSIVRALIPARAAWLWGLLLAASINNMEFWVVQLRGDFPGIFFGLTAIRLLLARSRHAVLLAGLCGGLALQFKITYVAPIAAGSLWLMFRRQWRDLGIFAVAGILTSAGLYLLYWLREPSMVSQMLAITPTLRDFFGSVKLMLNAISEPVVVLALPALPLVVSRAWARWRLLLLFVLMSFTLAGLADIQAGGNINYFFEGLFAVVPLAVLGVFRLIAWSRIRPSLALFVTGIVLTQFLLSDVKQMYKLLSDVKQTYKRSSAVTPKGVSRSNELFRRTEVALRGRHIFSSVPRMALLDRQPALVEPFLLSYLRRLGKFDPQPIVERIRDEEFDILITAADHNNSYRGVPIIDPDLNSAIAAAYKPHCALLDMDIVLYLPRTRPDDSLLIQKLRQIGCVGTRGFEAGIGL